MIHHILRFKWREGATPGEIDEALRLIRELAEVDDSIVGSLPAQIPGIDAWYTSKYKVIGKDESTKKKLGTAITNGKSVPLGELFGGRPVQMAVALWNGSGCRVQAGQPLSRCRAEDERLLRLERTE